LIRCQHNARPTPALCRPLGTVGQFFQAGTFFTCQLDDILLHGGLRAKGFYQPLSARTATQHYSFNYVLAANTQFYAECDGANEGAILASQAASEAKTVEEARMGAVRKQLIGELSSLEKAPNTPGKMRSVFGFFVQGIPDAGRRYPQVPTYVRLQEAFAGTHEADIANLYYLEALGTRPKDMLSHIGKVNSTDERVMILKYQALRGCGRRDEAKKCLQSVLKTNPNSEWAEEALEKLNRKPTVPPAAKKPGSHSQIFLPNSE
jgi:hypothetical protein